MKKVFQNAAAALDTVLFDGALIAAVGFDFWGVPESLIAAIRNADTKDLSSASTIQATMTLIGASCGRPLGPKNV